VGTVAKTAEIINIPDAYRDPRFNPEVDRRGDFRTRALLTVPMKDRDDNVIGAAQVLNKQQGGEIFTREDEALLLALATLSAVAIETVNLYQEQREAIDAIIAGLNVGMSGRDPSYGEHVYRVEAYSLALAEELGVPEEERRILRYSALLHDLGQIGVPDSVLLKKAPLTEDEEKEFQLHALKTKILLGKMGLSGEMAKVPEIAPFNHKRMDGRGYPDGPPQGDEIPFLTRILAVAAALDVMTCPQFGQEELSFPRAVQEIQKEAGKAFDAKVVEPLVSVGPRLPEIRREVEASYGKVRVDLG
jgi:HD-GYP domain-containing protein (c-di-GMP phosphodiesterase class II)